MTDSNQKPSFSKESLKTCSDRNSNSEDDKSPIPYARVIKPKVILLAFEGTMTPIDVEDKVIMPFLKENLLKYVWESYGERTVCEQMEALQDMSFQDHFVNSIEEAPLIVKYAVDGTNIAQVLQSVVEYALWKLYRPERAPMAVLKLAQGCWEKGYREGKLKTMYVLTQDNIETYQLFCVISRIFDDVLPAILQWKSQGIRVVVFDAVPQNQCRLMLSSTSVGDITSVNSFCQSLSLQNLLTHFLSHIQHIETFFDQENAGSRNQLTSYDIISGKLSVPKNDLLFVCHYGQEVKAAAEGGVKVVLLTRPQNPRNRTYYTLRYSTAETLQKISIV